MEWLGLLVVVDSTTEIGNSLKQTDFLRRSAAHFRHLRSRPDPNLILFVYNDLNQCLNTIVSLWQHQAVIVARDPQAKFAEDALASGLLYLIEWWSVTLASQRGGLKPPSESSAISQCYSELHLADGSSDI